MYIPQLDKHSLTFPNPHDANEEGIVAWGGDLNPSRLIRAYQNGIFPWYSQQDPILWWSTNPRLIMELDDFKLRRSLKKNLKKFDYKFDTNFEEVMKKCASTKREGQNGTWINKDLVESFSVLHGMGIAHSVESYQDGNLVGGLYGLVIGRVFCGESMFTHVNDASKAAYAVLVKHLKVWGYDFIDCQVPTQHLKSLGAKEVSRDYYLERLNKVNMENIKNEWIVEKNLIN
ncbi:leucyl/phenylalanyl-tRNA--protein transferase [Sulfurimonas autotrophica]|uniref:Leucyl/phenylalanyl-tRNA--protein transferase n=1 Tax=Sulfurimonas autotrophica (strain ATCC BAA-671 / DSM 16294 / JCM 11897 / OK10) TaxID=563040 RepID=E0UPY6_SULAO|nr:leucyl/phenylalanyl-tRNA--protein transferase [Sulfurimonas autotrophica]ADN09795.1 leucyl/phenylalanyl-tRNA/protein transferase [Sulfurimonas autotrophica DSM 16294]